MKNEEKTSVEVIEDINIKVNEILKEQKEFERNILEKLEQKNKIIMQRINKIVENYEILEMQNETIAKDIIKINVINLKEFITFNNFYLNE